MNYTFIGKNVKMTDGMAMSVQSELDAKLVKFFESPEDVNIEVLAKVEGHPEVHTCELTLRYRGQVIRAVGKTDDFYDSVSKACKQMKAQLTKNKEYYSSKKRRKQSLSEGMAVVDALNVSLKEPEIEEPQLKITKYKELSEMDMKPMTEEDAVHQMEMLGHDFYVFRRDDMRICVIYKRKDGFGLMVGL